jgi:hypothetical protein
MKAHDRDPLASALKNKFSPSQKRVRFVSFPVLEILGLCLSLETPSAVNLRIALAIFLRPFRHPFPTLVPTLVCDRGWSGAVSYRQAQLYLT